MEKLKDTLISQWVRKPFLRKKLVEFLLKEFLKKERVEDFYLKKGGVLVIKKKSPLEGEEIFLKRENLRKKINSFLKVDFVKKIEVKIK